MLLGLGIGTNNGDCSSQCSTIVELGIDQVGTRVPLLYQPMLALLVNVYRNKNEKKAMKTKERKERR